MSHIRGFVIFPSHRTVGQSNQEYKETSRIKCVSHVENLELRFLHNKTCKSWVHLILELAIVQNKLEGIFSAK